MDAPETWSLSLGEVLTWTNVNELFDHALSPQAKELANTQQEKRYNNG